MGMRLAMDNVTIFWIQILASVFVCVLIAVWYVWPLLTKLSRNSALTPLLFVHVFRYVGMTLLVTGMVDPRLPRDFLNNAAYGDLIAAAWPSLRSLLYGATGVLPFLWCGCSTLGASWIC